MEKFEVFCDTLRGAIPVRFRTLLLPEADELLLEMQRQLEAGDLDSVCETLCEIGSLLKLMQGRSGNDTALRRCFEETGVLWGVLQETLQERRPTDDMSELLDGVLREVLNLRAGDPSTYN